MKRKLLLLMFLPILGQAQLISEDFEAGIPETWSLGGDGNWGAATDAWGVIFDSNVAVFDDDAAGEEAITSDAELLSPVIDLTGYNNLTLTFDYGNYMFDFESSLDVEVFDGTDWVNIFSVVGDAQDPDTFLPLNTTIDVSAYANPSFQVRFIYNDGGDWSYGAVIDNVVLTGDLGVGDLTADSATGVYPNPAHGSFNVKAGHFFNADNLSVTLTDIAGKTVKSFGNSLNYNVSDLAPGLYMVKISDGNYVENKKLIVK